MASTNNIESPEIKKESRENFFEAVEADFKAEKGELVDIADKKTKEWKLSFFDKVKDFFESPYAGIKYLSSRVFGEKITSFMYELKQTKDNLNKAKDNVVEIAETALDKTKKVIEGIPDDIQKNIPVVGAVIASAMKVKDYFIKNSIKASEMPKDDSERMVWWKEVMKAAGVKESKLVESTLLQLLAEKSNWADVKKTLGDKVTGTEYEKELDAKIENNEFNKDWPFTGEKIGPAATKAGKKLGKFGSDLAGIAKDNPSLTATVLAYTGYKMGPKNGLNIAGMTGKLMLKVGLAPIKFAKNNPKKVILLLIAGRLAQQNTRWDEIAGKSLANTKLPKDYAEFNKVISENPAFKQAMDGAKISKQEFESAMDVIASETKFGETMDDILKSISPTNVVKAGVDIVGETPNEKIKSENLRGWIKTKLMIQDEDKVDFLKDKLGDDYEKLNTLLDSIIDESRAHNLGEVSNEKIEKLNVYSEITRYEINISDNFINLTYKPIDPLDPVQTLIIGPNPKLSESNKELMASTIKKNTDFMADGKLKDVAEYAAIGDVFAMKFREMFGVATDKLIERPEDAANPMNEKIKNGEAGLVSSGANFFFKYGTEYVLLPLTVVEHMAKYISEEDYTATTASRVYVNGLALVTVIGTSKFVGGFAFDKVYDLTVASKTGIGRTPDNYKMKAAKSAFKIVTYPASMTYSYGKGIYGLQKIKSDGLTRTLSGTGAGEIVRSIKNMIDTGTVKVTDRSANLKLMSESAKNSINEINNIRRNVISLRDTNIYMNNVVSQYSKNSVDNAQVVGDLVKRFQQAGLTDDLARVMNVDVAKVGEIKAINPDQLKQLLNSTGIALDVEKSILKAVKPSYLDSLKNTKVLSSISEWRRLRNVEQAFRITKLSKVGRVAKGSGFAALGLMGAMALGQSLSSSDEVEAAPEIKEKTVQDKIAEELVGAEVKLMQEVFNPKLAKDFQTNDSFEKRKEVMNGMKKSYLDTYNSLVNFLFQNQEILKGGLDEIVKVLQTQLPEANFKIKNRNNYFSGPDKVLSFGMGSLEIVEKPNGEIELGRMDVDLLEENMNMFGKTENEILTDIGTGLIPFYGTGKDFYRSYEASKVGNSEKATGEFFFGISSLASDIALPVKAGGVGLKLLGNSAKFKNIGKIANAMEKMSEASKVSSKVSKGATAGGSAAIGSMLYDPSSKIGKSLMGMDTFNSDINTYTKIQNG